MKLTSSSSKTLLAILTFLLQLQPSFQFASWFVERQSSCWVLLRDTTEVVMNNFIVSHEQSSHPSVFIELFDQDSNLIITEADTEDGMGGINTNTNTNKNTNTRVVYIEDFTADITSNFGQEQKNWSREFTAKINLQGTDLKDVQYVMDLKVSPDLDDEIMHKETGEEARIQAKFLSSSAGCNGYRAHGRSNSNANGLKFQLGVPSSIFKLNNVEEHTVDLVAGWATGHEAVTLTQSIVFRTRPKGTHKTNTKREAQGEPLADPNERAEEQAEELPLGEDTPNDYQSGGKVHREEINSELELPVDEEYGQTKKKTYTPQLNQEEDSAIQEVTNYNKKYDTDDFGNAEFTSNSYFTGLIVMVIVGGTVINAFLAMSGKSKLG